MCMQVGFNFKPIGTQNLNFNHSSTLNMWLWTSYLTSWDLVWLIYKILGMRRIENLYGPTKFVAHFSYIHEFKFCIKEFLQVESI